VEIASPVAVPDPDPLPLPLPAPLLDDVPGLLVALLDVVVAALAAVAVWTAGVLGWNARTPAVPAIVAAMTMGDRRTWCLRLRR
jgi:hypothetical protein